VESHVGMLVGAALVGAVIVVLQIGILPGAITAFSQQAGVPLIHP
jgi:hypothetical protein